MKIRTNIVMSKLLSKKRKRRHESYQAKVEFANKREQTEIYYISKVFHIQKSLIRRGVRQEYII